MGIFDKLKNSAMDTVMTAATSIGNKNETFRKPSADGLPPFPVSCRCSLQQAQYRPCLSGVL